MIYEFIFFPFIRTIFTIEKRPIRCRFWVHIATHILKPIQNRNADQQVCHSEKKKKRNRIETKTATGKVENERGKSKTTASSKRNSKNMIFIFWVFRLSRIRFFFCDNSSSMWQEARNESKTELWVVADMPTVSIWDCGEQWKWHNRTENSSPSLSLSHIRFYCADDTRIVENSMMCRLSGELTATRKSESSTLFFLRVTLNANARVFHFFFRRTFYLINRHRNYLSFDHLILFLATRVTERITNNSKKVLSISHIRCMCRCCCCVSLGMFCWHLHHFHFHIKCVECVA